MNNEDIAHLRLLNIKKKEKQEGTGNYTQFNDSKNQNEPLNSDFSNKSNILPLEVQEPGLSNPSVQNMQDKLLKILSKVFCPYQVGEEGRTIYISLASCTGCIFLLIIILYFTYG